MTNMVKVLERPYRSGRIGWTALRVWSRYKTLAWGNRLLRRDTDARDLHAVHQKNADHIFQTAVTLRGMLVKMCQVIGTRSDVFPREDFGRSRKSRRCCERPAVENPRRGAARA